MIGKTGGVGAIALAAIVWAGSAGRAGGVGPAPAGDQQGASPESPAAAFARVCGDCHDLPTITASRRDRQQWEQVIEEMIAEGARVTDDEFPVVMDYLLKHYGRVSVNRAEAAELIEVLGISEADAGRIVAHRKAHGPFADFDALVTVPDVDVDRLKAQRNIMTF